MKLLVTWQAKPGRKPLILKGIRQVGKTHLLQQFGEERFPRYHYINFEKQEKACESLFTDNLEPTRILDDLRYFLDSPIDIKHDLIIFDEIQACPNALTSLKYFCEELPELALCCAGSLLGLRLSDGSYPVGKVDLLHLHPMTFSEFLAGIGDELLFDTISHIDLKTPLSETAHNKLWQRLKHYFITGGLPEVVSMFAEQQDNLYEAVNEVRYKQDELIQAYYADIAKHSGKVNAMHIDRTWRSVPSQLTRTQDSSVNRFKFKDIVPGINRYNQLVNAIDWLESAELIIKIPLVETVQLPLQVFTKENMFKLFTFDVGILGAMSGLHPKSILDYEYGTYKGYFAENFVAEQLLASQQSSIFSWHEDRSEIEFLLQHEDNVIPIEVKSGTVTRAQSLKKYREKYHPKNSFILSGNNLKTNKADGLFQLPLYLTEYLLKFVERK